MNSRSETIEHLESKVKTLITKVWKGSDLTVKRVQDWYKQFGNNTTIEEDEQIQFLFLLSKFMYFGKREIYEMLRAVYRDLFKYSLIRDVRLKNNDTLDEVFLEEQFNSALSKTRFLGIGNPSESGSYLLYKFRQINKIRKELFINGDQIFSIKTEVDLEQNERQITDLVDKDIEYYIFLDDLTCSGSQAIDYSERLVESIKKLNNNAKVYYFVLVATEHALKKVRKEAKFDRVDAVFILDETFRCFGDSSRYYANEKSFFVKEYTKGKCEIYDLKLQETKYKLGFADSQLLLAFEHNTPDNVPPVFWAEGDEKNPWNAIFKRYHKIY